MNGVHPNALPSRAALPAVPKESKVPETVDSNVKKGSISGVVDNVKM